MEESAAYLQANPFLPISQTFRPAVLEKAMIESTTPAEMLNQLQGATPFHRSPVPTTPLSAPLHILCLYGQPFLAKAANRGTEEPTSPQGSSHCHLQYSSPGHRRPAPSTASSVDVTNILSAIALAASEGRRSTVALCAQSNTRINHVGNEEPRPVIQVNLVDTNGRSSPIQTAREGPASNT
ncbi:hypothetical protein BKA70DRAFT_1431799 [Coprinopsis sp. MPI-PUGE-AT-0042]|nr:hypothetical protein BKA70DRAFT_1431799 [Coprinopsis sp. MPI-PUGE-AT-0042]